jgi:hypothetical protein
VSPGESVVIAARLANPGDRTERDIVTLRVDGRLVATKGVEVAAGESELVTFERSFDRPGDHEITVAGTALPVVTVTSANESDAGLTSTPANAPLVGANDSGTATPGNVDVVATGGLADWVREGYDASVTVTLVNRENRTAARTVPVAVDGRRVTTETVRLGPNARRTVSVSFPAVEGVVSVAGVEAGRLSVRESLGPTAEPHRGSTDARGPGFGAVAGLLAVCAVVLRAVRRRSN